RRDAEAARVMLIPRTHPRRGDTESRLTRCRRPRRRRPSIPEASRVSKAVSGILGCPVKPGNDTEWLSEILNPKTDRSIQREARRLTAEIGRRIERLALQRTVAVLHAERLGRRDRI